MSEWKFFVLGPERSPLPNCEYCRFTAKQLHDPEDCVCLSCHGFYAATADPDRLTEMNRLHPRNPWAVRTGAASGIVVLDFEGPEKDPDGLTTLDRWEEIHGWSLPVTPLVAHTPSGGVHLYYQHPGGKVATRNRVAPGMDVKGDGGYVVVPHHNTLTRSWFTRGTPAEMNVDLARLVLTARGSVVGGQQDVGHGVGYDYEVFLVRGCPEGYREEFFNDLIFRLRRRGIGFDVARDFVLEQWLKCEQPPDCRWYWAWEHVLYKLDRIWRTVLPAEAPAWQRDWAEHATMYEGKPVSTTRGATIAAGPRWRDT